MKYFKLLALGLLCAIMLPLAACTGGDPIFTESTKYGVAYNHYVFGATIKMKNGVITGVEMDEAEGPYSWARISNITTEIVEADQITNTAYTGESTNNVYAKKIKIGDVTFTARANGENNNYVDYTGEGKNGATNFETWLTTPANAEWYFSNISSGNYDVLKADGTAYNVTFKAPANGSVLTKSDRWLKNKNGYWPSSDTRKGWTANMTAIKDYIMNHGFDDYVAARDSLEVDGEIKINGVATGATITNFKNYMDIALSAKNDAAAKYNELKK